MISQDVPVQVRLKALGLRRPVVLTLPPDADLIADEWTYRLRSRVRWRTDAEARSKLGLQARTDLERLRLDSRQLASLADKEVIQVEFADETADIATRIPWEPLIAEATREQRNGRPLLVVRQVARRGHRSVPQAPGEEGGAARKAVIVTSQPGSLTGTFTFDAERSLIQAALEGDGGGLEVRALSSPTLEALTERVAQDQPAAIHLSGFDASQATSMTKMGGPAGGGLQGFYLSGPGGQERLTLAPELAQALCPASRPPSVVTLNFFYSGGAVGLELARAGAEIVVGFIDEIDDAVAERFFSTFYQAWASDSRREPLPALRIAFDQARRESALGGTGIVIWAARSLVDAAPLEASPETLQAQQKSAEPLQVSETDDVRELIAVDIRPLPSLNYAILHNGGALFETFKIRRLKPNTLRDVLVEAKLRVGPQEFTYRELADLEVSPDDVNTRVRIPMTWDYLRDLRESTSTALMVEVSVGGKLALSKTFPTQLLPVEEWLDSPEHNRWLPSFVAPRDPAVRTIVSRARRYLMALRDDPDAGFDGYQSVDPNSYEPAEQVDLQVRALWSAIAYDLDLLYVNPPPTYSKSSQRLRSPSQVLASSQGTCIDLALLFAACLELVDIFPVLFLLKGHAFVGYWRTETAHEAFTSVSSATPTQDTVRQRDPWYLPSSSYDEVVRLVNSGDLVPLEAVWLAQRRGFGEAFDAGVENLAAREEFDAILDIKHARRYVTPIPFGGAT